MSLYGRAGFFSAILAVVVSFGSCAALANSDADELERIGYLGHWAQNCANPPSSANWHFLIQRTDSGGVSQSAYSGDGELVYVRQIKFIGRLANDRFDIQMIDNDNPAEPDSFKLTELIEPNRTRTWRSVSARLGELIRDGKMVKSGQQSSWLYRCRSAKAS